MAVQRKFKNEVAPVSGTDQKRHIVFFHPDLGIGGAERLIVDAAVGLQELGHKVTIFTSHCDPRHCFDEARDGTLDVRVRGNTIFPSTLLNRFHILLAVLRQIHLVLAITFLSDELYMLKPDVFVVDSLSACVPLLRWLFPRKQRTLFYCHFPDQLLAKREEQGALGMIKLVYRLPFDWFEGWSTNASDCIVVNSSFTKSVAQRIFPAMHSEPDVIHPCVGEVSVLPETEEAAPLWDGQYKILLSINRFERKKDVGLAIRAYHGLSNSERTKVRLVLAGGYDQRVAENVQCHQELVDLAESLGLKVATTGAVTTALAVPAETEILFLLSIPGPIKQMLLRNAQLLVYTPENEHFGIVPVEAMQHGVPVLASNTGGPLETVVEGETGWLCDVTKTGEWTDVMRKVLYNLSSSQLEKIGENGKIRVRNHFTRATMAENFDKQITTTIESKRSPFVNQKDVIYGLGIVGMFSAALLALLLRYVTDEDRRASEFARIRRQKAYQKNARKNFEMPIMGAQ